MVEVTDGDAEDGSTASGSSTPNGHSHEANGSGHPLGHGHAAPVRVVYEVAGEGDHIQPRLRLWVDDNAGSAPFDVEVEDGEGSSRVQEVEAEELAEGGELERMLLCS